MNPLIQGLFKKFREEEDLLNIRDSDAFELFTASLILPDDLLSQVQMSDLLLDEGTIGIDVVALDVNGQLAWDADDVREICENAGKVEVTLHFIQAKQSASVSSTDVLNFGDTVRKFLQGKHSLPILAWMRWLRRLLRCLKTTQYALKVHPPYLCTLRLPHPNHPLRPNL